MPFLLTFLASISTLIGTILIFIPKNKKIIIGSLGFAAGVMITISIIDLIPESFKLINLYFKNITFLIVLLFINIGIIISMLINKRLENDNGLYRVGIVSMIALILHNIPEGIITFLTSNSNLKLGISVTIAIAAHNIPEGITIALPIYYATNRKGKAIIYTFISGISEFVGAILAFLFLKNYINNFNLGMLFSITAGIMLYIAVYELLPLSLKYKNKFITILWLVIGSIFIYIFK